MQRRTLRVLAFTVFCIALATATWFGARWAERLPAKMAAASAALLEEKAGRLREKFLALAGFQPRIRINEKILAETTRDIAELAVLARQVEVEREFNHTWAGSTKTLRLRGRYTIKCGYDLLDRFEIEVARGKSRLLLPPATILSVEQEELKIEALENGFWNPVSAQDLQTAVESLKTLARERGLPLTKEADAAFAERVHRLLEKTWKSSPRSSKRTRFSFERRPVTLFKITPWNPMSRRRNENLSRRAFFWRRSSFWASFLYPLSPRSPPGGCPENSSSRRKATAGR